MLIHFNQAKLQQFDELAHKIIQNPEQYLQFDSVSDFYKAAWLDLFPKGTTWAATGLDDGATEFYAIIQFQQHFLKINCLSEMSVTFGISNV